MDFGETNERNRGIGVRVMERDSKVIAKSVEEDTLKWFFFASTKLVHVAVRIRLESSEDCSKFV